MLMQMKKILDKDATCRKIRELCKEKDVSVTLITEHLDVTPQACYAWLSLKKLPSVDHMVELADLLGTSIDELIVTMDLPEWKAG